MNINQAQETDADTLTIESTTADKGYHAVAEMKQLQAEGIRTVISDPVKNRKLENLDPEDAQVVRQAKRGAGSKSGKELLRRRGMHLERSFAHILDAGGSLANDLARVGKLEQAIQSVGGYLQPVAVDAKTLWGGHRQAVGGGGESPFSRLANDWGCGVRIVSHG